MDFEILYADGSTFTGKPEDAPTEYVIAIAIPPKPLPPDAPEGAFNRWTILQESDMYVYFDPPEGSWRVKGWHGITKYEDLKRHLKAVDLHKGEIRAVLDGIQMHYGKYRNHILELERKYGMTRA